MLATTKKASAAGLKDSLHGSQALHPGLGLIRASPKARRPELAPQQAPALTVAHNAHTTRDTRCQAWRSSWRTQTQDNNTATEDERPARNSQQDYNSPLFSPDFVSSLRQTIRRTNNSDASPNGNGYSNGNGNGHYSSNGNGNGHAVASSNGNGAHAEEEEDAQPNDTSSRLASWRSSDDEDLGGDSEEHATSNGASLFNDRFKAVLSESLQRSPLYGGSSSNDGEEEHAAEEEEEEAPSGGFFNENFKAVLQEALKRSPLHDTTMAAEVEAPKNTYEQVVDASHGTGGASTIVEGSSNPFFTDSFKGVLSSALERQQTKVDAMYGFGSDDDDPGFAPVRHVPLERPTEPSPQEQVLLSALSSSHMTLQRLVAIQKEVEVAIEREAKQVERLQFAVRKAQSDAAWTATLQHMQEQKERQLQQLLRQQQQRKQ